MEPVNTENNVAKSAPAAQVKTETKRPVRKQMTEEEILALAAQEERELMMRYAPAMRRA